MVDTDHDARLRSPTHLHPNYNMFSVVRKRMEIVAIIIPVKEGETR